MNYEIKQEDKRTVAGFHLVGPWEQTVKKGFEQLMMWVDSKNIVPKEWVAVYYDNPDETPAEKLRCDTVVTVHGAEDGYWDIEMYVAVQPKHH
ncbi:TPA: GyrI-like domain-containing protein [Escherichia coli]|nr:GyrI-like domain-containing protein [Escherichia coli]